MRIDTEQMNQFQSAEDVSGCEQTLRYQLRIEIAPCFSRDQSCHRVLINLRSLLKVRGSSKNHSCDVEKVFGEVDEIPHVS